jgi:hypothetical protein
LYVGSRRSLLRHLGGMGTMFLKGSGWRKFAQLMPDHVFSHKYRVKNLPVMDQESVPNEIRRNHGAPRPGFDWPPRTSGTGHFLDLLEKLGVHEWTFL